MANVDRRLLILPGQGQREQSFNRCGITLTVRKSYGTIFPGDERVILMSGKYVLAPHLYRSYMLQRATSVRGWNGKTSMGPHAVYCLLWRVHQAQVKGSLRVKWILIRLKRPDIQNTTGTSIRVQNPERLAWGMPSKSSRFPTNSHVRRLEAGL